jgi:hypothetical protein
LTVNIPRAVLDAKQQTQRGGEEQQQEQQNTSVTSNATADDSSFRVLIDGKPVPQPMTQVFEF